MTVLLVTDYVWGIILTPPPSMGADVFWGNYIREVRSELESFMSELGFHSEGKEKGILLMASNLFRPKPDALERKERQWAATWGKEIRVSSL